MSVEQQNKEEFLKEFISVKKTPELSLRKKKKSTIWNHFDEMSVPNRAKCLYCTVAISYSGGSSGNLKRHLRLKHPEHAGYTDKNYNDEDDDGFGKTMQIDDLDRISEAEMAVVEITATDSDINHDGDILTDSKEPRNKTVVKRLSDERQRDVRYVRVTKPSAPLQTPSRSPEGSKHEYDFFGEYVSSALKSLPPENAIAALGEIMEVISREKMSALVGAPPKKS